MLGRIVIRPSYNYGFKLTFADESDTVFLRKALQSLIQSKSPIDKVEFLSNEFIGITTQSRAGLYDLICEDENGNTYIVEMQLGHYKNYIHRAKFYAFQRFNTLVSKGQYKFDDLTPIYCIGFLAKGIFPKSQEYYHFGTLKNQKGEELDAQITHIIVEIDKFDKKEGEIQTNLDKLIYLMKNQEIINELKQLPKFLSEDWIEKAIDKLDKSRMTPEQRMHFEMMLAKNASIIEMEKEERRIAIKEAEEKARKEAEEKARKAQKEAEEKARKAQKEAEEKARKEKHILAIKLFEKGMSIDEITELIGLKTQEIEKIVQNRD